MGSMGNQAALVLKAAVTRAGQAGMLKQADGEVRARLPAPC